MARSVGAISRRELRDPYVIYNKRANLEQQEFMDDCNQAMDTLLVFAGLFSAITTAFIIETYKDLKREPEAKSEQLLQAILERNWTQPSPGFSLDSFTAEHHAVVTNTLFFLSLSISLVAALGAILVKQWARKVFVDIKKIEASRERARNYLIRKRDVEYWRIPEVVALVPMLLHVALAVFFVGLIFWLKRINPIVSWVSAGVGIIALILYTVVAVIPTWSSTAPFRWPVSTALTYLFRGMTTLFRWISSWTRQLLAGTRSIVYDTEKGSPLVTDPLQVATSALPPSQPDNAPSFTSSKIEVILFDTFPPLTTIIGMPGPAWEWIEGGNIDKVDLGVFHELFLDPDPISALEDTANALITYLVRSAKRDRKITSTSFKPIVRRFADCLLTYRAYSNGTYEIRPGQSQELAITMSQFFEIALQVKAIDTVECRDALKDVLGVIDLLLQEGMRHGSVPEIVLYASVSAQLSRVLQTYHHLNLAVRILSTLGDFGPCSAYLAALETEQPGIGIGGVSRANREKSQSNHEEWTAHELEEFRTQLSTYIWALTQLVITRFSGGTEVSEKDKAQQDELYTRVDYILSFLALAGDSGQTFPLLRERLEPLWLATSGCSLQVEMWTRMILLKTGSCCKIQGGEHLIES
ncbi:hypothetical protein PIIN_08568 [Serendipita indica DSM 11827]|uniref:DUF6535 domain-containing protein n=1 Tax=Serendipita indica (strain DSM 11827) TaxID=1109443 RepID=G4TTH3_SERID|nr:hypothetical protein PIIN_08568 [Serendipita indica DSM 11827]